MLLDVSALDQVLDHAAGDLIVATQAGALLADVQAVGRPRAASGSRSTRPSPAPRIGGTARPPTPAAPAASPTGTARDLLIGITVVRADGVVAKAGGRVVKNVAGYDLGKLLIGSFGTLAVITEAIFRLHPLPGGPPLGERARSTRPARRRTTVVAVGRCTPRPSRPRSRSSGPPAAGAPCSVLLEGREDGVAGRAAAVRDAARARRDRVRRTSRRAGRRTPGT